MSLRPVQMSKVKVIGLRKDLPKAVAALHEAGLVEIRGGSADFAEREAPGGLYKEVSEQLIRLRGIENYLKKGTMPIEACEKLLLAGALAEARALTIDSKLSLLGKNADSARERKREILELRKSLSPFRGLGVDFSELRSTRLRHALGSINAQKLHKFRKALDSLTKNYNMVVRQRADKAFCLVAIDRGVDPGAIFGEAGFIETDISKLQGKPGEILADFEKELEGINTGLASIEKEIMEISGKHYSRVAQLREMLEIEADRLEVASKFGRTSETFAFQGFMPKKDVTKLEECLHNAVGWRFLVKANEADEKDAPTLLEHGKATGPLQFLVEFYSLPKVGEIDPTNILLFTFPIIYGMMLGDVVYGLISLAISMVLIKKFRKGLLVGFAKLWAYASVPAIAFGVIFDEWLGFTHAHLLELLGFGHAVEEAGMHLPLYNGMSRIHDVQMLLALALITGFIQLLFGFALGAINDWGHHRKHSYAKIGWMGVLTGGFFAVSIMFFSAFPAEWLTPAGVLFGIGILLVVVFEGPMGLFEVPGLAGNVLSYARIAGVGLAGVVPAEFIINKLLLPKPEAGLLMAVVMIPVF
ncbi:MAG: V-type ATPase 116kDa subunit family protein, partial [Candidatus Micrarchaeota archaeon]